MGWKDRLENGFWARLGRHQLGLLLGLSLIAGLLFAFVELAGEVVEGDTLAFDKALLLAMRDAADPDQPGGPWWLARMARDLTSLGSTTILTLTTVAALGFLLLLRKRAAALLVLVSVGGGMALSSSLKAMIGRARPDLVPHGDLVVTASFPSGHAMLSAIVYLTIGALLAQFVAGRRVKAYLLIWAMLLTLLIGASRVYLAVHWPTDVLAGWCIGAAWAALCWIVAEWLQRRGAVEQDRSHEDGEEPAGRARPVLSVKNASSGR
ncbi:phosphatase PAP2 family protein [Azospirillum agricola]|uniref:phosphatase PAP2 family protein n=1 Tax=Azospirillum agricola TaxID=1720247 RepID=UPI000A0EF2C4|nr:phosphatase PAP2 family protein [Azospirillum agricola]SMH35552.1 undecaprenyl-diphosphatase [Azospirillum lipoferum]